MRGESSAPRSQRSTVINRAGHGSRGYPSTPRNVSSGSFGLQWESQPFDAYRGPPGRMYASPLYLEGVTVTEGPFAGVTFALLFAATTNSDVYAFAAFSGPGLHLGILGTPVIDQALTPPRLYVAADTTGGSRRRRRHLACICQPHRGDIRHGEGSG